MTASFRDSIRQRAAAAPRRIVFPESSDVRTLEAVAELHRCAWCVPVLIGDPEVVHPALAAWLDHPDSIEVIDPRDAVMRAPLAELLAARRAHKGWTLADAHRRLDDPLLLAAMLVRTDRAHGFVAGAVNTTGDVIRAAIWGIGTAPGVGTVSSSFYMVVPPFRDASNEPEVLTFTDAAVVAEPTARELADIASAAVAARRAIVGDAPVVAFLSYSTRGSADGAVVRTVREAAAIFRAEHPDIPSDGELQADAALVEGVALRKAPGSAAGGRANILVFPNLDAGNIAYKLVQRIARADALGPVLQGLDRPCSDLSRGATASDIVDVACVTALQATGSQSAG